MNFKKIIVAIVATLVLFFCTGCTEEENNKGETMTDPKYEMYVLQDGCTCNWYYANEYHISEQGILSFVTVNGTEIITSAYTIFVLQ